VQYNLQCYYTGKTCKTDAVPKLTHLSAAKTLLYPFECKTVSDSFTRINQTNVSQIKLGCFSTTQVIHQIFTSLPDDKKKVCEITIAQISTCNQVF